MKAEDLLAEVTAATLSPSRHSRGATRGHRQAPLPCVYVPQNKQTGINEAAGNLSRLMGESGRYFHQKMIGASSRRIVELEGEELRVIDRIALAGEFETVASLVKMAEDGPVKTFCGKESAELIAASPVFRLPLISTVTPFPYLRQDGDDLREIVGHDEPSGVYAKGSKPVVMDLAVAVALIEEMLSDFDFATPGDRARAIASLFSPALINSNLLGLNRVPMDITQAYASQSGKGFRTRLVAAVYGVKLATVTQKGKDGVGSVKESFDACLVRGVFGIQFDNWRGRFDFPWMETFCTEFSYGARPAFSPEMAINPALHWLSFTSNEGEITRDMANRSNIVRIRKRPKGFEFKVFDGGRDILAYVEAQQGQYLGAVFAVLREWHRLGMPRSSCRRDDAFKDWARVTDWLAVNIFGCVSVQEGHDEAKMMMTEEGLVWLRKILLSAVEKGLRGRLHFGDVIEIAIDLDLTVGKLKLSAEAMTEGSTRERAMRQLGMDFKRAFTRLGSDRLVAERAALIRCAEMKDGRERYFYLIEIDGVLPMIDPEPLEIGAKGFPVDDGGESF